MKYLNFLFVQKSNFVINVDSVVKNRSTKKKEKLHVLINSYNLKTHKIIKFYFSTSSPTINNRGSGSSSQRSDDRQARWSNDPRNRNVSRSYPVRRIDRWSNNPSNRNDSRRTYDRKTLEHDGVEIVHPPSTSKRF